MQSGFRIPSSSEDLKKLSEEITAVVVLMHNIKFTNRHAASYLGLSIVRRGTSIETYHMMKERCTKESAHQAGALLAQVSIHVFSLFEFLAMFQNLIYHNFFQFGVYLLHLFNIASASESQQRYIDAEACTKGVDFIQFQEDQVVALRAANEERGLTEWTPPIALRLSFCDLVEAPVEGNPSEAIAPVVLTEASTDPNVALIPADPSPTPSNPTPEV